MIYSYSSHGLVSVLYSITTFMTLLRGAQQQDKRQQPHSGTREMSFYCECGQALEQASQRGCGVSIFEDT